MTLAITNLCLLNYRPAYSPTQKQCIQSFHGLPLLQYVFKRDLSFRIPLQFHPLEQPG